MDASVCILKKRLQWFGFLITYSILTTFSGYGILSCITFTSLLLISSTILSIFSSQRRTKSEKPGPKVEAKKILEEVQADGLKPFQEIPQRDAKTLEKPLVIDPCQDLFDVAIDNCSENEGIGHLSSNEDFDSEWPFSCDLSQSPECSENSVSDDESLFEIALSCEHIAAGLVDKEEPFNYVMKLKFPDLSSEVPFCKSKVWEVLAETNEMNEEENLFEIDLSMESIRCSTVEIEA